MSDAPLPAEGRPPAFTYRRARKGISSRATPVLCCDDVPLPALVERFGTPLYVYSASTIRKRFKAFDRAFRGIPHTICYSVKANSNLAILRLLRKLGCGFDIVSGGELERVLAVDSRAAKQVVFSGVGKTALEMRSALHAGILLFNVESESELQRLAECAGRLKKKARIAVRVNPDVPADTHAYISTGLRQHKFGIPINHARALYAHASAMHHLTIAGVSVHIGSQVTSVEPFAATMERVAELVCELRSEGHRIDYVDAGGGLGIDYDSTNETSFFEQMELYARALVRPLRGLEVRLLLEPGRAIVGPAGALVTSITYKKENSGKRFLVTDAAMNDLVRPSLYDAYHEIIPVNANTEQQYEIFDVVGPICETGDFFAHDRRMREPAEGDLLAILDSGAYGMSLASNYNSRPRAAEVLVDGKSLKLIRKRESTGDLFRLENI